VKIYEKIMSGVWSMKGIFDLIDYYVENDGKRNVFKFILRLSDNQKINITENIEILHTRLIPSSVKLAVWKRDKGNCVLCGSAQNLHFDHDLPFSKGGTSLSKENVRLLCMKHNLEKSDRIE
ncbi:MAG TPA: HNH endonuclease, partial [Candidatus Levybacteria bacterium]|nr:HNH endonuclease [Candidatus Levybacteria bacterium]